MRRFKPGDRVVVRYQPGDAITQDGAGFLTGVVAPGGKIADELTRSKYWVRMDYACGSIWFCSGDRLSLTLTQALVNWAEGDADALLQVG